MQGIFLMRSSFLLLACAVLPAPLSAFVLVDTVSDYSTDSQGVNGLTYGYYTAVSTSGSFSTVNVAPSGGEWVGAESFGTVRFGVDSQHPGADSLLPAVRRYTVGSDGEPAYSGQVLISGTVGGPSVGGGAVEGFVTVDGAVLFSASVDGSTPANFSFAATVAPGSVIDFGVGAAGDPAFDTTFFSATVTAIPEPASGGVLAGLVAAGGRVLRRRRRV